MWGRFNVEWISRKCRFDLEKDDKVKKIIKQVEKNWISDVFQHLRVIANKGWKHYARERIKKNNVLEFFRHILK